MRGFDTKILDLKRRFKELRGACGEFSKVRGLIAFIFAYILDFNLTLRNHFSAPLQLN